MALRSAHTVFALSPYTARQISRLVPKAQVVLAPCGVDTQAFQPDFRSMTARRYLLSVGRFSDPRKNLGLLLQAYALLRKRVGDCPELWIAGEPPSRDIQAKAERGGFLDGVRILGRQPDLMLQQLYPKAMLFVLSSDEEGLGMVILEAMASGLPVVCTKCGGPDYLVESGRTGLLVPLRDPAGMARAMEQLIRNPQQAAAFGRAGREKAESSFSKARFADVFVSRYREVLS